MPSPKGTLLLTGANGGTTTSFVFQLLKSPSVKLYKGYYTVRDPGTALTLASILEIPRFYIRTAAAAAINKRVSEGSLPPIRALVLNAGVQEVKLNFTSDGIEQTFAINYLHNFLLVLLLLQSMYKEHGRVVLIGSTSICPDWWPNSANYATPEQRTFFTTVDELVEGTRHIDKEFELAQRRYAMSKVIMIMFMYELQRRLNTDPTLSNISVIGLDPGWVSTAIGRNSPMNTAIIWTFQYLAPVLNYFWPNHYVRTATKTGDDLVRVCFDQEKFGEYPKALYVDGSEIEARMNEEARDEKKREKLWKGSLRYAGIKEYDTVLVGWK